MKSSIANYIVLHICTLVITLKNCANSKGIKDVRFFYNKFSEETYFYYCGFLLKKITLFSFLIPKSTIFFNNYENKF